MYDFKFYIKNLIALIANYLTSKTPISGAAPLYA
jgi:hypothetical protein